MPNGLVVGTEDCSKNDVKSVVCSPEFESTLFSGWTNVAIDLYIPTAQMADWKQKALLDIMNLKQILCKMVDTWVDLKGCEAYLVELQKAFANNGLKSLSEKLENKFKKQTQEVSLKQKQLEKALEILCSKETLAKILKQEEIDFDFETDDELAFPPNAIVLPKANRGCALLLNINEFRKKKGTTFREGSVKDTKELNKCLSKLGFKTFPEPQVQEQGYKSKQEILELLKDFLEFCKKENANSVFVFIGSHGRHPNQIGTSDRKCLDLFKDIVSKFYNTAVEAEHLKGKPKMFLVQACQGFNRRTSSNTDDDGDTLGSPSDENDDVDEYENLSESSNIIICFSTHPGGKAKRNPTDGAYFVQRFMRAMSKFIKTGRSYKEILQYVIEMTRKHNQKQGIVVQVPHVADYHMTELYFEV